MLGILGNRFRRRVTPRAVLLGVAAAALCVRGVAGAAAAQGRRAADANEPPGLYTDRSDVPNPDWEELKQALAVGQNSLGPNLGSTIRVNRELVGQGPYPDREIPRGINIHTPTSNGIRRRDFGTMTRWYHEDGHTQVFRMFPGDENVGNQRALAPHTEAFGGTSWKRGDGWREWSGRYTFLKVRGGAVFQINRNTTYWSMPLDVVPGDNGKFDLVFQRLHDPDGKQVLARDIVGELYDVRVLYDGTHHRVYINGELRVGGEFTGRNDRERSQFRWGFHSPKKAMDREIRVFVTGAYVGNALDTGE